MSLKLEDIKTVQIYSPGIIEALVFFDILLAGSSSENTFITFQPQDASSCFARTTCRYAMALSCGGETT